MRNFTDGVFAIGIFLGVTAMLAVGPVSGLLNWHKITIGLDALFSSAAGALVAVLVGVWLLSISKEATRSDDIKRAAKTVRIYLTASRVPITHFAAGLVNLNIDWCKGRAQLHPLLMLTQPTSSARASKLPFEVVEKLATVSSSDVVAAMISMSAKADAFNTAMENTLKQQRLLLEKYAQPPHPYTSGKISINSQDISQINQDAERITEDLVALIDLVNELEKDFILIHNEMLKLEG